MEKNMLVLAPHTDDGEFGCGGTIARFANEGSKVWYVAFSAAEKSVPDAFPKDILRKEVTEAMEILGVPESGFIPEAPTGNIVIGSEYSSRLILPP